MLHFNIGSRSAKIAMPEIHRPTMFDMARMAVGMGLVDRAVRVGGKAAMLGSRAAMRNPRLTVTTIGRAMPEMPWQNGMHMPWYDGRHMPWQSWATPHMSRRRMPWQRSRSMPWLAAIGLASWPWMQEQRRHMPWKGAWQMRMPVQRQRRGSGLHSWQLLLAAAAGGLVVYLLDPEQGNRRRKMAAQRLGRLTRTTAREMSRAGRGISATMAGKSRMLMNSGRSHEPMDDATLAHKVESLLFRDPDIPKGNINVNSEHGVVVLRGEVESPDQIHQIEMRVRAIEGVQDVRTLLHDVHTSAPMA
jgi:osmotically-inducible protein OsmY